MSSRYHYRPAVAPKLTPLVEFEPATMNRAGWVTITEVGAENVYFTLADGTRGFCKLG